MRRKKWRGKNLRNSQKVKYSKGLTFPSLNFVLNFASFWSQNCLKVKQKFSKKWKKNIFSQIASNIDRMLKMCPWWLPDIQKVIRTHIWFNKMIWNTFSKIEFWTHKSNFWLGQLWTSLKNSIFKGLFQVWGQSQYHVSKVTTIVGDSLGIA